MSFPSFASGEVLTAADMNAVGMWRVATASPSGAQTTDITNCFSSDYDFYLLEAAYYGSTATDFQFRFLTGTNTPNTAANYNRDGFYYLAGVTNFGSSNATSQFFGNTAGLSSTISTTRIVFHNPFSSTTRTACEHFHFDVQSGLTATFASQHTTTTSFTGLRIYSSNGSTTLTGRINVYGYRN
jgi:hypothetical protein